MTTAQTLGNGTILVNFDNFGQVKDFYFPYPGLENHIAKEMVHKIGVYADDKIHWFTDPTWKIDVLSKENTMAGEVIAYNENLSLRLKFTDVVYNEKNIFLREIVVENLLDEKRDIKVLFNQQFVISQTISGDTAYYDPRDNTLIHYKGRRVFLINVLKDIANGIDEYSVGLIGIEGKEGTFKDAEDGVLTGNSVEHGRVDSVAGVSVTLEAKKTQTFYYWITAAKSLPKAKSLNTYVLQKHPSDLVKTTSDYWKAWVTDRNIDFSNIPDDIVSQFNRSLLVIRTHVADNGAVLASGDSSMLQYGRDTYSYVWPRDSAMTAIALTKAGDYTGARKFFNFANKVITEEGYFMHKYRPDTALGSSWHPWIWHDRRQLPIQEDETALVIYALWIYYEHSKDLEFIEKVYNSLIKSAAEFMVYYINKATALPEASYDLWEEKYGIHTYTASTVSKALWCASQFAQLLGKDKFAMKYLKTSENMKKGILKFLFDSDSSLFYKLLSPQKDKFAIDPTVDFSSIYGVFAFDILKTTDPRLLKTVAAFTDRLALTTPSEGVARFEGDMYHRSYPGLPGNPWIITSLWHTQFKISQLTKEETYEKILEDLRWVITHASDAGLMSEQLEPFSGKQKSATPLIWSHAEYVITVLTLIEKLAYFKS